MSIAPSLAEDRGFINIPIPSGVDLGPTVNEQLPLRRVRSKYQSVVGIPYVGYGELRDMKYNRIYPLYQNGINLGVHHSEEGSYVYAPMLSLFCPQVAPELSNRCRSRPWLMFDVVKHTRAEVTNNSVWDFLQALVHPISVYTKDAHNEALTMPEGSYYRQAFNNMEDVEASVGLFGTLHMNSLVNLNLDDNPNDPSFELRDIRPQQLHFYCPDHTSHSTQAGMLRRLAHGVTVRLWSNVELNKFIYTLGEIVNGDKSYVSNAQSIDPRTTNTEYNFYCGNMVAMLKESTLDTIVNAYNEGKFLLATLYDMRVNNKRVVYINITNGVLLRKVGKVYYDSRNLPKTLVPTTDNTYSTPYLAMCGFEYNKAPRTLIASCQSIQAICKPFLYQNSMYIPSCLEKPLVISKWVRDSGVDTELIPGQNLCVALINVNDNYEDCFLLNEDAVREKRLFEYTERSTLTVRVDERITKGTEVNMERFSWWTSKLTAVVESAQHVNANEMRLILVRTACPTDGDKMATLNGQKGVIKMVKAADLPQVYDPLTDTVVVPDLVISASSVVTRVTVGQFMELRAGRKAMETGNTVVMSEESIESLRIYSPGIVYDANTKSNVSTPSGRLVMCEWGYARVGLLHHLTLDKHHFTRKPIMPYTKYSASGRLGGGSIKLGAMELEAMGSSGLTHCLTELLMRRDMSIVNVCTGCNAICVICDCLEKNNVTRRMMIPYSTILTAVLTFVTKKLTYRFYPDRV